MCGRRVVLKQLRLGHVCSTVSGVVCPILALFLASLLMPFVGHVWKLMYLYFLFWTNLEMESIIQWTKCPPDIASRIKSVYSHPFLVLASTLCRFYFPSPFPVGCSPSGAGLTAPSLLTALSNYRSDSWRSLVFWQRCLWGWRCCTSQGRQNLAIYRPGFSSEFTVRL